MNFRKASIISLGVTFLLGIFFYVLSLELPMSMPGIAIGAGYYPRVLSGLLTLASAAGIVTNIRKKDDGAKVPDMNVKLFFFVLVMAVILTAVWQFTYSFFPICTAVVLILLWVLNPEPAGRGKAVKTIAVAAVLVGVIYVLFSVILDLNL